MLSEGDDEAAMGERTYREWHQRFKNDDFQVEDRHSDERAKVQDDRNTSKETKNLFCKMTMLGLMWQKRHKDLYSK